MPNAPKTPTRTFRCPDNIWQAAKEKAAQDGLTLTDILLAALISYTED
jgi:non-ribosomal peptide synthetase component F